MIPGINRDALVAVILSEDSASPSKVLGMVVEAMRRSDDRTERRLAVVVNAAVRQFLKDETRGGQ
jgi:hypothetical protein